MYTITVLHENTHAHILYTKCQTNINYTLTLTLTLVVLNPLAFALCADIWCDKYGALCTLTQTTSAATIRRGRKNDTIGFEKYKDTNLDHDQILHPEKLKFCGNPKIFSSSAAKVISVAHQDVIQSKLDCCMAFPTPPHHHRYLARVLYLLPIGLLGFRLTLPLTCTWFWWTIQAQ